MKRIIPFLLITFAATCLLASFAWAASPNAAPHFATDRSPGAKISEALTTVTGIAISPLLGTSALGAYEWVAAKDDMARAALPWYAQPKFWLPALLVVGVCALKDSLGAAVPPMLKKPLDALEVMENKFSGMIAAGAVVPVAMDAFSKLLLEQSSRAGAGFGTGGLAMMPLFGVNWAPALDILTIPFGIAVFAIVWMASHAINVLILLSPWGAIDAGLKAARTALLGLLVLTTRIHPAAGALLSVVVIVVAYFVAGWAFRLTVFGAVLCWDFFTGRRGRFVPADTGNRMFSAAAFTGLPVRTYGRLNRTPSGGFEFVYRPWLVMQPRAVALPFAAPNIAVGSGLIFSTVTSGGTVFLLPPRYRGHEAELVQRYGFGGGVRPAGLRKAWSSLKELVGGRGATAPATG